MLVFFYLFVKVTTCFGPNSIQTPTTV